LTVTEGTGTREKGGCLEEEEKVRRRRMKSISALLRFRERASESFEIQRFLECPPIPLGLSLLSTLQVQKAAD